MGNVCVLYYVIIRLMQHLLSGRMLMETDELPVIIPMWLTGVSYALLHSISIDNCVCCTAGFDQVMNESRGFPRFLPRPGKRISITFGDSAIVQDRIRGLRESCNRTALGERESAQLRATITRAVQEELEKLGDRVSGSVTESIREGK